MTNQFEYDEKGTFYYFLLALMTLLLIPATLICLCCGSEETYTCGAGDPECRCHLCHRGRQRRENSRAFNIFKHKLKVGIVVAWIVVGLVFYKASQVEFDWSNFDPYEELDIGIDVSKAEVRKAYRKLSLVYHPDKETGDADKFMRITNAYQVLSDPKALNNWKKYGNPDGPKAVHLGFALPKWIVEKDNEFWVLGFYGLVLFVIIPGVGLKIINAMTAE